MKFLNLLLVFIWLAFISFSPVNVQAQTQVLLLPPEFLIVEPVSGSQSSFGLSDFSLSVSGFNLLQNGATCAIEIRQARVDGTVQITNANQSYNNGACNLSLPASQQISNELDITLRVTNTDQKVYGLDFKYFFTSGSDLFIDPDVYELPDSSLYNRPEIEITVKDRDLTPGKTTTVQYSFRNLDNFTIRDFELESNLSQNARIICDSFSFTDQPLDGFTVYNPFNPIKLLAAEGDNAECDGDLKFKANIKDIKVGQVTRLNFDIEVTATGDLSFNILTNLDQGRIAYQSEPIEIVDNFQAETNNSNFFSQNPVFAFSIIGLVITSIAAGGGYYYWKKKIKKEE